MEEDDKHDQAPQENGKGGEDGHGTPSPSPSKKKQKQVHGILKSGKKGSR
jgi:hypothetical protein